MPSNTGDQSSTLNSAHPFDENKRIHRVAAAQTMASPPVSRAILEDSPQRYNEPQELDLKVEMGCRTAYNVGSAICIRDPLPLPFFKFDLFLFRAR
jgi:hypothetical protein